MIGPDVRTPAIRTENLTKRYGKLVAVDNLRLSIPQGSLFGFIGPNGAGKTTTLRMIAGLIRPTSGSVYLQGEVVRQGNIESIHHQIGYMPDFFGVYEDMRTWEYLDFFARCYGLSTEKRASVVTDLLDLVDLAGKRHAEVDSLSRGMKQRLCLAHALVHDPSILLLDEPASGLDPRARIEIRELLQELRRMGKTIVISSHILSELAEMCDEVGIMERGRLVAWGPLEAIERKLQPRQVVRFQLFPPVEEARRILEATDGVFLLDWPAAADSDGHPVWVNVEVDGDAVDRADILTGLFQGGIRVAACVPVERDLENVFLRVTKGEVG